MQLLDRQINIVEVGRNGYSGTIYKLEKNTILYDGSNVEGGNYKLFNYKTINHTTSFTIWI